jgi:uncharacterized protein involved in outer membrane biogenesis
MQKKKLAIAGLALITLYALAGFLAAPAIIKPRLVASLEHSAHRIVNLGGLRINPFTLSATLKDFRLLDRDTTPLLSFKELYLRYRITSVFRHVWALAQLRLDTPYVAIRLLPDGKLSINDLFSVPPADSSGAGEETPRPLEIGDLYVAGGTIVYQDFSRGKPLTKAIDSLDVSLKEFTTVAQQEGMYEFEAVTRQDERFHWRGNIGLAPLRSAGMIELASVRARTLTDFIGDSLLFAAGSGTFSARAEYTLDSTAGGTAFALRNGRLDITDLVLTSPLDTLPPVSVPSFHAGGISLDYPRNALTIDTVRAEGANIRTAHLADGTITLQQILTRPANPADTSESHFEVLIRKLSTRDFSFLFMDRSREPEGPIALTGIDLELTDFRYGAAGSATLAGSAVLNGGGSLQVNGALSMDPLRLDLDLAIAGSPLAAFRPWAERYTRAEILGGTFGLRGKLAYAEAGKTSDIRFRGGIFSDGGRIRDPLLQEDLLRWGRLEVRKAEYRTLPASLQIAEIAVTRPYARVIVAADRSLNLQHLKTGDSTSTAAKDTLQESLTTIGKVSLIEGSMNFADLSLSPNFDIGIQQLNGTITGLSSKDVARAEVELAGQVDNYAPVTIRGQINPLSGVAYTDITMKFDGIDLTTFTPYFSKFAGYRIERGKLSLDLRYRLNNRHLDGENKIVLNQLTLGEKVESPDATSLPVKLAVALLKDSKGVIDLDIPISGSLDDPEFSVFPIVFKAFMNLLWKMVTSPFSLLGALFGGGGDDLQYVLFEPGVDSLAADQQPKLQALVKGLTDRPALQLEVKGASSPPEDRKALAEAAVLSKVRPGGTGHLAQQDEKRILEIYRSTFKEEPEKLLGEGKGEEHARDSVLSLLAWQRLVDSVRVSENDLRALAQRRAAAVMGYVCQRGGIDPGRIFLVEVDTGVKAEEARIRTTMNLTAH